MGKTDNEIRIARGYHGKETTDAQRLPMDVGNRTDCMLDYDLRMVEWENGLWI